MTGLHRVLGGDQEFNKINVMGTAHPANRLFRELASALPEPYPDGVGPVDQQIQGTSFFPGGVGLVVDNPPALPAFPVGGVMVLGHDFHSREGYEKSRAAGAESVKMPTWARLLALLDRIPIKRTDCFFTNIYMGLREGKETTGPFPGATSPEFVQRCRNFFLLQIAAQKPSLILTLGANVPPFLAPLSPRLTPWAAPGGFKAWDTAKVSLIPEVSFGVSGHHGCVVAALVHPSFRPQNLPLRRWRGLQGDSAEVALVREASALAHASRL